MMISDRDFWLIVRRALLLIISAIERKYQIGGDADQHPAA
jgi:hypothetical protein